MDVDYAAIEQKTSDSTSAYFFPKLFAKYLAHDSTLAIDDYHHLYYGYTFQPSYNSLARNESERLTALLNQEKFTPAEYQEIIQLEKNWLETSPFDLEAIYFVLWSYDQLGDQAQVKIWDDKLGGLLDAVLGSGDGSSLETAFHVAKVDDEYFLLEVLGLRYAGEQNLIGSCDYLKIQENEYGLEGLYFNVERHFACLKKMFDPTGKD